MRTADIISTKITSCAFYLPVIPPEIPNWAAPNPGAARQVTTAVYTTIEHCRARLSRTTHHRSAFLFHPTTGDIASTDPDTTHGAEDQTERCSS